MGEYVEDNEEAALEGRSIMVKYDYIRFDEEPTNVVPFVPKEVREEAKQRKADLKRILAKYHRPNVENSSTIHPTRTNE